MPREGICSAHLTTHPGPGGQKITDEVDTRQAFVGVERVRANNRRGLAVVPHVAQGAQDRPAIFETHPNESPVDARLTGQTLIEEVPPVRDGGLARLEIGKSPLGVEGAGNQAFYDATRQSAHKTVLVARTLPGEPALRPLRLLPHLPGREESPLVDGGAPLFIVQYFVQ